jgi:hypothetical protein
MEARSKLADMDWRESDFSCLKAGGSPAESDILGDVSQ